MNFFRIVCKKPEQICIYPPLDSYYPVEKKLHLPGAVTIRQRPCSTSYKCTFTILLTTQYIVTTSRITIMTQLR